MGPAEEGTKRKKVQKEKGDTICVPRSNPPFNRRALGRVLHILVAPLIRRRGIGLVLGDALIARRSNGRNSYLPIACIERRTVELSTPETSLRSVVWVVVLAALAVISGIQNPLINYIQILGGECDGNGRQIVRCRDISGRSRRKYLHRSGKPLLKRWRTYFGLRSVEFQRGRRPELSTRRQGLRHSCHSRRRPCCHTALTSGTAATL